MLILTRASYFPYVLPNLMLSYANWLLAVPSGMDIKVVLIFSSNSLQQREANISPRIFPAFMLSYANWLQLHIHCVDIKAVLIFSSNSDKESKDFPRMLNSCFDFKPVCA